MNFAKILRITVFTEHLQRLLHDAESISVKKLVDLKNQVYQTLHYLTAEATHNSAQTLQLILNLMLIFKIDREMCYFTGKELFLFTAIFLKQ